MTYNEQLIQLVKAAGQDVIDRAEELVGTGTLRSRFEILIRFPQDGEFPTIEVTTEFLPRNVIDAMKKIPAR